MRAFHWGNVVSGISRRISSLSTSVLSMPQSDPTYSADLYVVCQSFALSLMNTFSAA